MSIEGTYNNAGEVRTAGYMPVFGQKKSENVVSFKDSLTEASKATESAKTAGSDTSDDENGFLSFLFGILDVINPLQHIPVISTIYRHLTGDEISPMARIAGDTLYGGPIGAAVAVANVAVEHATGKDIGDTVLAMVTGDKDAQPSTMLASNLNNIAPAAAPTDIIWNDATVDVAQNKTEFPTPLPPAHPPARAGAAELQPAFLSYKDAAPVLPPKGGLSDNAILTASQRGSGEEFAAITRSDIPSALHLQEAPADHAGTDTPPELIAYKMMEALDKYSAMKKAGI